VASHEPRPGEIWAVDEPSGHAVFLGDGLWNILVRQLEEYSLNQVQDLTPVHPVEGRPAGLHWADQFDALAAAAGLPITWASEIAAYQAEGFAKIAAAGV
jgi:hypothetical protein